MATTKIRKQCNELTADDLAAFPVWEFALNEEGVEGQDETTVRPFVFKGVLDASSGSFLVKADYTLADGSHLLGYLTPPPASAELDLGHVQPCIVTPAGHVNFWYGAFPISPEDVVAGYSRLGKTDPAQVFPIQFESAVPLSGESIKGRIPGFLGFEDWRTGRIQVTK
jgi:hypothetical protein